VSIILIFRRKREPEPVVARASRLYNNPTGQWSATFIIEDFMVTPLISVIIPTWNSAEYLPTTLDSVFAQTWNNTEVIVVDDGSTDNTRSVLEPYGDKIRYFRQENWGGPSRPRNVAIDHSRGDFIAFFDSDDLMDLEKLTSAAKVLQAHPDVDFTFSNFRSIDETSHILNADFLADYTNFRRNLKSLPGSNTGFLPGRVAFSELLKANFVGTSSVVCRRKIFDKVGLFDETMLNADDVDMWRRIAYAGFGFAFIDQILHSYRKRGGGVSDRGGARRLPAILASLRKQLALDLSPEERLLLERRIHAILLGFGDELCAVGQFNQAEKVFREALNQRFTLQGCKGLLKVALRLGKES
jgi:glycosyltransferase involved in cell wall biosynthesis